MIDIKKFEDKLNSEEGEKFIAEYLENMERRKKIHNYQIKRFHTKFDSDDKFIDFISKVIEKYDSDAYVERWYKRGIEPPQNLFWFLFEYSKKYGRVCNEEEYKKYSNEFTTELFFIRGFYIMRMDGQGSVIKILK